MDSLISLQGKTALITGANQGIGFELCRQLAYQGCKIILSSRDINKGEAATNSLKNENLDVNYYHLDITETASIDKIFNYVVEKFHHLDIRKHTVVYGL